MRLARNVEGVFCLSVLVGCVALPLLPSSDLPEELNAKPVPAHTVTVTGKRDATVVVANKRSS